ncbi:MAG: hypothetical protein IKL65_05870 [Bacilli bacterium]|nr:hypothetical protein [Bacilli bacterium]
MKKKVVFTIIVLCLMILVANPVFAANIASCENSIKGAIIDEKIPNIVSTIVTVIKIVVPVLLVIMGMLDLMKGITAGKEDEIKKGQQIFIKRLISGALVFLVFTIVQLIISFVADDNDKSNIATCSKCFLNGDCTYKFKDEKNKVCPDNMHPNDTKTVCVKDK